MRWQNCVESARAASAHDARRAQIASERRTATENGGSRSTSTFNVMRCAASLQNTQYDAASQHTMYCGREHDLA